VTLLFCCRVSGVRKGEELLTQGAPFPNSSPGQRVKAGKKKREKTSDLVDHSIPSHRFFFPYLFNGHAGEKGGKGNHALSPSPPPRLIAGKTGSRGKKKKKRFEHDVGGLRAFAGSDSKCGGRKGKSDQLFRHAMTFFALLR